MQLHDHNNIERLYLKTLAAGVKSLAVTACEPKAGVTTLAMALTQRHLLAGHSVLYVELNSTRPSMSALCPLEADTGAQWQQPMLIQPQSADTVVTGVLAPTDKNQIIALRNIASLQAYINELGTEFDAVVIDCASLCGPTGDDAAAAVPADIVAAVCDANLLIVQGGVTKAPTLKRALALLATHDKKPTAVAINQQFNPTLGQELIREIMRFQRFLPKISKWLCEKLQNSLLIHPL